MYCIPYKYWKIRCKDFLNLAKTYAGHYSYDIHGNVKSLVQQNPSLATLGQDLKKIDYEYDLISGKVNTVKYQDGQVDAFFHHYEYDADNRLTNVYTSKYPNAKWTGIQSDPMWEQDEKLFYYLHGSLARVELGDEKVQGLDYVYTIQGWLKGCNSNNLNPHNDIGQDGETSINNLNKNIARDAYGYSLNYYNGDYQAIDPNKNLTANSFTASATAAAYLSTDAPGLFNGNISSMVNSLTDIAPGSSTLGQAIPQLTAYRYDQLNRVKQMKAYRDINLANNAWGNGSTYDGSYETHLSYDANGNILTMQRNGVAGVNVNMDNLNYIYETTANGYSKNTNKLRHVNDNTSYTSNYQTDIDDEGTFSIGNENYDYDEIGQQKQDKSEGIASQEWNVYGKVKSITRYNGSTKPDLEFNYNASGQRISKTVKPRDANGQRPMIEWITTHYVKDAQGNTLAVYEQSNDLQTQTASFKIKERYMYGSNRLGTDKTEVEMIGAPAPGNTFSRTLGNKTFDLTNHRGDVITSVSDRKIGIEDTQNPGTVAYYKSDIITTSETYLFGQPMPGRNIGLSNERHGYQGQEKVDEINGKPGTHYTAEYWEYNALTGRRENNDPVVKPWRSPYDAFSNNPITHMDPLGDDDYFNKYGTFLGSDGGGNKIRVVDFTTTIPKNFYTHNNGQVLINKNVGAVNSAALSSLNYNDLGNRKTLSSVATYYAGKVGVEGVIGAAPSDPQKPSEAQTVNDKNIYISYNKDGKINANYDDMFNLQNTIFHEDEHRKIPGLESNIRHVDVVIGQISKTQTWGSTTSQFQADRLQNATSFLNKALQEGTPLGLVQERITKLNDQIDKTGTLFSYDKESNSVSTVLMSSKGVEVETTK